MRTARSSSGPGGVSTRQLPRDQTPPQDPQDQAPHPGPGTPQSRPPPWKEFLTHASENITLPQTSFAGGKDATEKTGLKTLRANKA